MTIIDFSSESYWNEKYNKEEKEIEWYQSFNFFYPYFKDFLKKFDNCANLGCGNSTMFLDLLNIGFNKVINIDICENLIENLKFKYKNNNKLEFITFDCRNFKNLNLKFDLIIEKGTIDALSTSPNGNVLSFIDSVYYSLNENGIFISISFGSPILRLSNFKNFNWKIFNPIKVQKPFILNSYYYIYIISKN